MRRWPRPAPCSLVGLSRSLDGRGIPPDSSVPLLSESLRDTLRGKKVAVDQHRSLMPLGLIPAKLIGERGQLRTTHVGNRGFLPRPFRAGRKAPMALHGHRK